MTTLIFDCDGVLADTERDGHLVAFNKTFEEFDLSTRWTPAAYSRLLKIGGGKERLRALTSLSGRDSGIRTPPEEDDVFIARLHRRKTENFIALVEAGALPARPGIARIVSDAAAAGWTLAVASTSAEASVRAVLRSAVGELASQFEVFAGDVVSAKKPAPDIYLLALEKLGAEAQDTVVIEDSGPGAAAAAAAGLSHLVTVSTFTAEDAFPSAAAVVTSLGEGTSAQDLDHVLIDRTSGRVTWPISLQALEWIARNGRNP